MTRLTRHLGILSSAADCPRVIALAACLAIGNLACASPVGDTPGSSFLGTGSYTGPYWPTLGWRTCRPEEVGMDSDKLLLVYDYAANPAINTEGLIVVKDGYIVGEAYFRGWTMADRHASYSMAKSVASTLIGIARDRGSIGSVNDEVYRYYPEWQTADTPDIKKRITIRHLLTMTAGLEWQEEDYYGSGSQDDIFRLYRDGVPDFIQYVLDKPVTAEPGSRWYYSSGESLLLSGIIESATGVTALRFAREQLFDPLGISSVDWESDPAGHTITAWGLMATVRDYAKFGYLLLNDGNWDGDQIVSADWVREATSPASDDWDHYGYQWWLKTFNVNGKSYDAVIRSGWGCQKIILFPEHELMVVMTGGYYLDHEPFNEIVTEFILPALED